jgi:hypothetical protein
MNFKTTRGKKQVYPVCENCNPLIMRKVSNLGHGGNSTDLIVSKKEWNFISPAELSALEFAIPQPSNFIASELIPSYIQNYLSYWNPKVCLMSVPRMSRPRRIASPATRKCVSIIMIHLVNFMCAPSGAYLCMHYNWLFGVPLLFMFDM